MAFSRDTRSRVGLLVVGVCFGVLAHASVLRHGATIFGADPAGRGPAAATQANSQCMAQCARQAGQCDLACSQGPNALQCAQQCNFQYQQCISSCN